MLRDSEIAELGLNEYAHMRYKESRSETPQLAGENAEERRRREISYLNLRWFMQTLLDRMDRASMAYGLEARVPFADHRIVEYLYNVPWNMKYREGVEKALMCDVCRGLCLTRCCIEKESVSQDIQFCV